MANNIKLYWTPIRYMEIWKSDSNGEIFLLGISGTYHLNKTAGFIWRHLDGSTTILQIINKVCTAFKKNRSEVQKDIIDLLNQLERDDLIVLNYDPLNPIKELHTIKKR